MRVAAIFLAVGVVAWAPAGAMAEGPVSPSDQDRLKAKGEPRAVEGEEKRHPPPSIAYNGFGAVALSPDGKYLAASGAPGTAVRLWDAATGKEVALLRDHDWEVTRAEFSRDGKRLYTATAAEVRAWDVATRKQLQHVPVSPSPLDSRLTLSADGRWFVSDPDMEPKIAPDGGFVMATIRLWDMGTGKEARSLEIRESALRLVGDYLELFAGTPRSDEVRGTAISQDGKWVVAGGMRGLVRRWDAATGKEKRPFGLSKDFVAMPLGFSKDGKWLVAQVITLKAARKPEPATIVRVWEVATGKAKHVIEAEVFERGLSDDGERLVTGRGDTTVRIWDVATGKELHAFAGHKKPVRDAFLSADRKFLVAYDEGGTATLWDVGTGKELRTLQVRPGADRLGPDPDFKVRVSADARLLVAWTPFKLTLWDLEKGKEVRSLRR
jgi:WD40 repeat protein